MLAPFGGFVFLVNIASWIGHKSAHNKCVSGTTPRLAVWQVRRGEGVAGGQRVFGCLANTHLSAWFNQLKSSAAQQQQQRDNNNSLSTKIKYRHIAHNCGHKQTSKSAPVGSARLKDALHLTPSWIKLHCFKSDSYGILQGLNMTVNCVHMPKRKARK